MFADAMFHYLMFQVYCYHQHLSPNPDTIEPVVNAPTVVAVIAPEASE